MTPRERLTTLLPTPRTVHPREGILRLDATIRASVKSAAARTLVEGTLDLLPMCVELTDHSASDVDLRVVIDGGLFTVGESYRLEVDSDGVSVVASDAAGVVYAIQTLRQLLPSEGFRAVPPRDIEWTVAACDIVDWPSHRWRGALIDVARHFLPKHELLRQIDVLAAHKINRVQLHLTDDQGWRIESKAFPSLHTVGSTRAETQTSHFDDDPMFDGTPHGGFYSRADIQEIVRHAAARAVTIVPEIELPGHTGALLAAYPDIGSPVVPGRQVLTSFGVHNTLLNPGPRTIDFLTTLFSEICELFDSPWVHVGGDESVLDAWQSDPAVVDHCLERGLHDPAALFDAFLVDVQDVLRRLNRTMITWDDSFATQARTTQVATNQVVMAWRGPLIAERAAAAGHEVILAPVRPTYFDYSQAEDPDEPLAIGGPVTLRDVASWQPVPDGWSEAERRQVLGVQCQLWTEYIKSPRHLDYMLYPRAIAFAQVAWAGPSGNLGGTLDLVAAHLDRLTAMGIEFRPLEGPRPWQRGGNGRNAYRPSDPLEDLEEYLSTSAAAGVTATGRTPDSTAPMSWP